MHTPREFNSPEALELRARLLRCANQLLVLEGMMGSAVFFANPDLKHVMADKVFAASDGLNELIKAFVEGEP